VNNEYKEFHVFTMYCPGPFFWGHHLYMVEVINGIPTPNRHCTWLHGEGYLTACRQIAEEYGLCDLPQVNRYSTDLQKAIAQQRPQGFRILLPDPFNLSPRNYLIPDWLRQQEAIRTTCWDFVVADDWRDHPLRITGHIDRHVTQLSLWEVAA
jgi:hypothetical protein